MASASDIDAAAERLRGVAERTPLHLSARLSEATGAQVWLKREDLQPVRSYKVRGAYNLLVQLPEQQRAGGAVCASAGNHGQGVALAGARLGIRTRVYLPRTTPRQKRERITALGGTWVEVRLVGDTYDEAASAAMEDVDRTGAAFVPAFDDDATIAGQGTVVREVLDQLGREPDLVVVPVGGGGLLAGTLCWTLERAPGVRVVGVEPAGAASMQAALAAGTPVPLASLDGFVDGAAVRRVGDLTFGLVRDLVDEVVTVDEGSVCTEMLDLYQVEGIVAEPAGALATAALADAITVPTGSVVVAVVSGGNNDVSRYGEIVERSLIHQGLKHYFLVEFPQEPGALRGFLDDVLSEREDITLFEYVKKNNRETGPALVGIEIDHHDDLAPLLDRMAHSRLRITPVPPGSPLFTFLVS